MTEVTQKGGQFDLDKFSNIIAGELCSTIVTRHGINPATLQANPEVPVSTEADVDAAVSAARRAFGRWSKTTTAERKKAVLAYADGLEKYKTQFATLLTQEQGKPSHLALSEAESGVTWLKGLASIDLCDEILEDTPERQIVIRHVPLGVAVGIVPWNFPIQLAIGKLASSVLAGCPIIIKPSPFTPYCGLKLVELAQRYFPPGVVQALSGDDHLGPWLSNHPGVDKISFTGSTATGKKVMESASRTLKRVTLELGGNDAAIICPDVDIEAVAPKIATFAFLNSGQICLAVKRIYVHQSIYEQFRDAVVRFTQSITIGDGSQQGIWLGPVQNSLQFDRANTFLEDIETENWTIAAGGVKRTGLGYFIAPTIIDKPDDQSRIVQEEPFSPIVPLLSWSSEEEVISRANDSKMALGASVWSSDLSHAAQMAEMLEAGSVWVNEHMNISPLVPFGGHKESGIGYEWSVGGLKSYCNVKALYLQKEKK